MKNSKVLGIILAYMAGQATQLVIHGACLANNMYNYRQIRFCLAAGFILLFTLIAGAWIARGKAEKPAHEKTYLDWAKIPEEDMEVIDPFEVLNMAKAQKEKTDV